MRQVLWPGALGRLKRDGVEREVGVGDRGGEYMYILPLIQRKTCSLNQESDKTGGGV